MIKKYNILSDLGQFLDWQAKRKKYSTEVVALTSEVSRQTYTKLLHGNNSFTESLARILEIYEIYSLDKFLQELKKFKLNQKTTKLNHKIWKK